MKLVVDKTDEVIYIIRHSKDQNDSKLNLMERFGVTDLQAAAIVAMRLGQLSGMERIKIEDEPGRNPGKGEKPGGNSPHAFHGL